MIENISRGEGLFINSLSRIRKILLILSIIIILSFSGSIYYKFKTSTTAQNWKDAVAYFKADLFSWDKEKEITYPTKIKGKEFKVNIRSILYNPSIKRSVKKIEDTFYSAITLGTIISVVASSFILILFYRRGMSIKQDKHKRGQFLITEKELKKQINNHNKYFKQYNPFSIANFPYPITGNIKSTKYFCAGEQTHTLLIGSTGSGKTRILFDLIEQLRAERQKAIIIDIKGDYIQHFYEGI